MTNAPARSREEVVAAIRKSLWQYDCLVDAQRRLLYQYRDAVLAGEPRLAVLIPERHAELVAKCGGAAVDAAERGTLLALVDLHWSEFLAEMAEVREGIFLRVIGDQNRVLESQRIAIASFMSGLVRELRRGLRRSKA